MSRAEIIVIVAVCVLLLLFFIWFVPKLYDALVCDAETEHGCPVNATVFYVADRCYQCVENTTEYFQSMETLR